MATDAPPLPAPAMSRPIVSLASLCAGDEAACDALRAALRTRGWSHVRVTPDVAAAAREGATAARAFFSGPAPDKDAWALGSTYGYQCDTAAGMQAYRLLSGPIVAIAVDAGDVPPPLAPSMRMLCAQLDLAATALLSGAGERVFGPEAATVAQLARQARIPLVRAPGNAPLAPSAAARAAAGEQVGYGQLEVVEMGAVAGSDAAAGKESGAVAEQTDGGLFTLSVLSTGPGLELRDPVTGEWVPAPATPEAGAAADGGGDDVVGVLWCGAAAGKFDASLKLGTRRVVRDPTPRDAPGLVPPLLTVAYEVCADDQVADAVRRDGMPHRVRASTTGHGVAAAAAGAGADDGTAATTGGTAAAAPAEKELTLRATFMHGRGCDLSIGSHKTVRQLKDAIWAGMVKEHRVDPHRAPGDVCVRASLMWDTAEGVPRESIRLEDDDVRLCDVGAVPETGTGVVLCTLHVSGEAGSGQNMLSVRLLSGMGRAMMVDLEQTVGDFKQKLCDLDGHPVDILCVTMTLGDFDPLHAVPILLDDDGMTLAEAGLDSRTERADAKVTPHAKVAATIGGKPPAGTAMAGRVSA